MTRFRKALDRLRLGDPSPGLSLRDQLKFLPDPPARRSMLERTSIDSLPEGQVEANPMGSHYIMAHRYPADYRHGKILLSQMSVEKLNGLLRLARCSRPDLNRERIIFLDTETTGVHGGAGMCPFLIGAGFFRGDDFCVTQYFMRDFDEEASMLLALGEFLGQFDVIVTYNGQAFDLPLVENRCVLSRLPSPFDHLVHFDLLFMARRLWRAGHGSCRLTALEERLVGFLRGPDIPGSMIPRAYFDYLQGARSRSFRSVFSHNIYDIISLACLTIHASGQLGNEPPSTGDPLDLYSLGRIFDADRNRDKSILYYEAALESPLPSAFRIRILERLALLYRVRGEHARSLRLCEELISQSEFSFAGYEGAAIYHEYRSRKFETALKLLDEALERIEGQTWMERRRIRIQARRTRVRRKLEKSSRRAGAGAIEGNKLGFDTRLQGAIAD
jgi:uncharacterized protein YprB with RNaseH-like and TPR domain